MSSPSESALPSSSRASSVPSCSWRDSSTVWGDLSIDDYSERTKETIAGWRKMNGRQGGDPAKLASALVMVSGLEQEPLRWMAGADAVASAKEKANLLLAQADAHLDPSTNLDH